MAAKSVDRNLSPEEKRFRELVTTGDDFMKIEIFRSAAAHYRKALQMRPDDAEVKTKLDETYRRIRSESKAIYIIVAVAAVLLIVSLLIR